MKRVIALILSCIMLLTGCGLRNAAESSSEVTGPVESTSVTAAQTTTVNDNTVVSATVQTELSDMNIDFSDLGDPKLLRYIEDDVYSTLVDNLNSEGHFVENVSAKYVSKEYLEEAAYNSRANIYFGYTLSELGEQFQDTKYVFSLGDNGQTIVKEFESYDDTYDKVIRNVAIGSGVIILCVTVSAVTGGAAPAISMIFAISAKTGAIAALSSGAIGGVAAGIVTGFQTKDFDKSLKSAALSGSEGFMWGAITGAISGGASEAVALKGATLNGLKMNQAASIQRESKYPLDLIKSFHSEAEYNVYKTAKLKSAVVNGKTALIQDIDWDFVGDVADGRTNAERVIDHLSPLDPSGNPYNIHHVGQKPDSPFAILTKSQHQSNYKVLHSNTGQEGSEIVRTVFEKEKDDFWLSLLQRDIGGIT